jgi:hypothetical protein
MVPEGDKRQKTRERKGKAFWVSSIRIVVRKMGWLVLLCTEPYSLVNISTNTVPLVRDRCFLASEMWERNLLSPPERGSS